MKKKNLLTGLVALMFALSLNYRYATNDYGILENALLAHAQASSSSSSNSSSSNQNGNCSNMPCSKKPNPIECTLYKYGNEWRDKQSGETGFSGITKSGTMVTCPNEGLGCTEQPCRAADEI